jgi:hypothetical protein
MVPRTYPAVDTLRIKLVILAALLLSGCTLAPAVPMPGACYHVHTNQESYTVYPSHTCIWQTT